MSNQTPKFAQLIIDLSSQTKATQIAPWYSDKQHSAEWHKAEYHSTYIVNDVDATKSSS